MIWEKLREAYWECSETMHVLWSWCRFVWHFCCSFHWSWNMARNGSKWTMDASTFSVNHDMTGRCQPLSAFIIKWQTFFCSRWISGATHGECSATLMDNWSHLQPGAKKSGMDHRDHQQNIPGWWFQPLWKIWKSIGIIIPNIWKSKSHVPVTTNQI